VFPLRLIGHSWSRVAGASPAARTDPDPLVRAEAQARSLEERVYPSRRFDVLGLVQRRPGARGGPRGGAAPGLGVYAAWLGGLPGFLSGARDRPAAWRRPCDPIFLSPVLGKGV